MRRKNKLLKEAVGILGAMIIVAGVNVATTVTVQGDEMYMSYETLTLQKGKTKKLKVKNLPKKNTKVKWSTSNKFAVTVSKKGRVKAVNYGYARIKAKVKKKTLTCLVTVPNKSNEVKLNVQEINLLEGERTQIKATSKKKVTFLSSNTSVATVDSKGNITACNPGSVVITAKSSVGYDECNIQVNSKDAIEIPPEFLHDSYKTTIRQVAEDGSCIYDKITWAKGLDITLRIDNIDETKVKSCKWSVTNESIMSKPNSISKIQATAKTLNAGKTIVKAVVVYKNGSSATYENEVIVTNPVINTSNLVLLGGDLTYYGNKYVTIGGIDSNSNVTFTNSNENAAFIVTYNNKVSVRGVNAGNGMLTAIADGRKFVVNYVTENIKLKSASCVVEKGKTTRIGLSGLARIVPTYKSRNKKIATVDKYGKIKAKKTGVTYIDVKIDNITYSYRVDVAAKGMNKIIKRANYIVNNWKYSQSRRMSKGYYDCSALVWKGYKAYKKYNKKLGSSYYALPAGTLFDYLQRKGKIVSYGLLSVDDLRPGDLVFYGDYDNAVLYSTPGRTLDIYHVSMYAGDGRLVEKGGRSVWVNSVDIVGIGRVVK